MRNTICDIADMRKRVFAEVAKMAYEQDYGRMDRLPYEILPGDETARRDTIFLERAIVGERVRLAMGLPLRSIAEHSLLSTGVEQSAVAEKYYDPPLINIIKYACNACPPTHYEVTNLCQGCLAHHCSHACPKDAIEVDWDETNDILNCKMAEYAAAVLKGRPHFHISLVIDVSPNCDCHAENDVPIVPDVGMFASFDPVALDMACADAVNRQPVMPGSWLDEREHCHHDHFCDSHPETDWRSQLVHAAKLGIGSTEYELIRV